MKNGIVKIENCNNKKKPLNNQLPSLFTNHHHHPKNQQNNHKCYVKKRQVIATVSNVIRLFLLHFLRFYFCL